MSRPETPGGRSAGLRVWAYVAAICLAGMWPDFILNRVTIPLSRSLVIGVFGACGFWLLLAVMLGFLGGRYRSWSVTLGGVIAMSLGTHFGEYVYDVLYGVTPGSSLLPNQKEASEVLMYLGIGIVAAAVAHFVTARVTSRRFPLGYCQNCGYDLTGNVSGRCPECGREINAKQG
ncbi:MAG: hypothetical protein ACE5I3_04330 [Phycisphaerae bacterium]